jgi:hypothetical protein
LAGTRKHFPDLTDAYLVWESNGGNLASLRKSIQEGKLEKYLGDYKPEELKTTDSPQVENLPAENPPA